mmetsp:Transcript_33877/g.24934  ORF Transcript_33877/g.24934 Transcript_33877/m.24934 type:complete len:142 (-) Transcript_33877:1412-1837(-)
MLKAIQTSYQFTLDNAPFQLISRYLAAYLLENDMTCDTFVIQVVDTQEEADAACANYDFNSLSDVQAFMSPVYYSGTSSYDTAFSTFVSTSGLTKAQATALFDTTDPASFGGVFLSVETDIIAPFYCPDASTTTCSYELLA